MPIRALARLEFQSISRGTSPTLVIRLLKTSGPTSKRRSTRIPPALRTTHCKTKRAGSPLIFLLAKRPLDFPNPFFLHRSITSISAPPGSMTTPIRSSPEHSPNLRLMTTLGYPDQDSWASMKPDSQPQVSRPALSVAPATRDSSPTISEQSSSSQVTQSEPNSTSTTSLMTAFAII